MTGSALNGQSRLRPSCAQMLSIQNQWALGFDDIRAEIKDRIDLNAKYNNINEFIQYFLQTKYNVFRKK